MTTDYADLIGFGDRLARMRRTYGERIDLPNLGRVAFATLLGISAIAYDAYERGDQLPTVEFLAVLRNKIGASIPHNHG